MHAAVIAINEAIDHGVPEGTLAAMQNPNAMLVNLDASSAGQYHETLCQAKGEKVANSRKRVRTKCQTWADHKDRDTEVILKGPLKGLKLPVWVENDWKYSQKAEQHLASEGKIMRVTNGWKINWAVTKRSNKIPPSWFLQNG